MPFKVRSRYVPDNASMARFLLSSRVGDVAEAAARDIADDARRNMLPYSRSGRTAEGYEVRPAVGGGEAEGGPRRTAVVWNEQPGAAPNEFGNGRTPERRPLRNAAEPYHVPRAIRRAVGR